MEKKKIDKELSNESNMSKSFTTVVGTLIIIHIALNIYLDHSISHLL